MIVNSIPYLSSYGPEAIQSRTKDYSAGVSVYVDDYRRTRVSVGKRLDSDAFTAWQLKTNQTSLATANARALLQEFQYTAFDFGDQVDAKKDFTQDRFAYVGVQKVFEDALVQTRTQLRAKLSLAHVASWTKKEA